MGVPPEVLTPGSAPETAEVMRSLTTSCFVDEERPKIRLYHGIPTLPSSSWTMTVTGVVPPVRSSSASRPPSGALAPPAASSDIELSAASRPRPLCESSPEPVPD